MDERLKHVVEPAEGDVCGKFKEGLAAFAQGKFGFGTDAAWDAFQEAVEHLKECSECQKVAKDLLVILWLEIFDLTEEPPGGYPKFDLGFLPTKD